MKHSGRRMRHWLKNSFIPHEGNNHRPHILRPRTIAFVCVIILLAELGFITAATYIVPRYRFFGLIESNALVDGTNAARQTDGLSALDISPLLTQAAQEKANDMVQNNYFAHTSPSGLTPWYWLGQVNYQFGFAGENLAVNFSDSQDVTNAWMNSPEHRANILNRNFTQIGIATARGTYNGQPAIYVVELFGTPASAPIAFLNSAAAAVSSPATAPVSTPSTTPPSSVGTAPASTPKPVAKTSTPTKKAVVKPVAVVTTVVATTSPTSSPSASNTQPLFLEIPAAVAASATNTATSAPTGTPATSTVATGTPAGVGASASIPPAALTPSVPNNILRYWLANPMALTNRFYLAIMILFAVALLLNLFVKIRLQFPRLIFGGMAVIVLAGLLVLFNQSITFAHVLIL